MAHFAELNENNLVINVLVVDNSVLLDENNQESEALGIAYLQNLFGSDKKYIQATINGVVSSVPINEMNMDYAQIKRQVDAGELTIEDAD